MSGLHSSLNHIDSVWALALRGRIAHGTWTFRSTPISLTNKEVAAHSLRIHFSSLLVHNRLLRLHNRSRLALVVNTDNLIPQFKLLAGACCRKGLQDGKLPLTIYYAAVVEVRDAGDRRRLRTRIEIGNFLVGELEGCTGS